MSYQNNNNRCQGWVNPSDNFFGPQIFTLSSFYSPAGSTSLVTITGVNFYSYSSIAFGAYYPTIYFINSNILQFYVPNTLNSGTYPIQVFNGSIPSNIVTYSIDNSSGYWLLNTNGTISNTNTLSISVSSISRGLPSIITDTTPQPFVVSSNINWIIGNTTSTDVTILLPSGTQYIGRELMIKNISANKNILASSSIIIPYGSVDTNSAQNVILSSSSNYTWVTLVCYDVLSWMIMQRGA